LPDNYVILELVSYHIRRNTGVAPSPSGGLDGQNKLFIGKQIYNVVNEVVILAAMEMKRIASVPPGDDISGYCRAGHAVVKINCRPAMYRGRPKNISMHGPIPNIIVCNLASSSSSKINVCFIDRATIVRA
jgi:hypothetical protein